MRQTCSGVRDHEGKLDFPQSNVSVQPGIFLPKVEPIYRQKIIPTVCDMRANGRQIDKDDDQWNPQTACLLSHHFHILWHDNTPFLLNWKHLGATSLGRGWNTQTLYRMSITKLQSPFKPDFPLTISASHSSQLIVRIQYPPFCHTHMLSLLVRGSLL